MYRANGTITNLVSNYTTLYAEYNQLKQTKKYRIHFASIAANLSPSQFYILMNKMFDLFNEIMSVLALSMNIIKGVNTGWFHCCNQRVSFHVIDCFNPYTTFLITSMCQCTKFDLFTTVGSKSSAVVFVTRVKKFC